MARQILGLRIADIFPRLHRTRRRNGSSSNRLPAKLPHVSRNPAADQSPNYFFTGPDGTPQILRIPPTYGTPYFAFQSNEVAVAFKTYASGGASGTPINFTGFTNSAEDTVDYCEVTLSGHLR